VVKSVFVSADSLMNHCLEDVCLLEAFLHENILSNVLSSDDYITLGKLCFVYLVILYISGHYSK